jgi:hypothetical protein
VKDGAEGLEKIVTTDYTQQLPPGTATGMAIGTEIAPARPAPVLALRVWTEMRRRVDLAAAPPCGHETRWRSCGRLRAGVGGLLTGVAVWPVGETGKGLGRTLALWRRRWRHRWRRARGGVAGPCPLEQEAQPEKSEQHQLGEKELGDHGKTPSYQG